MADDSVFPLVLAIKEDGSIASAMSGFESDIIAHTRRAGSGFDALTRQVDRLRTAATQKIADPLGIQAQLRTLSTSPLQRSFDQQASAANALAQQQARASADRVAQINREFDAAMSAIRQEQSARAAAFAQAQREGEALASLDRQRAAEMARTVAAPSQQGPGLYFDPRGTAQAAQAARQQANALQEVADAAQRVAVASGTATGADRAFAATSRDAANAAALEADRLDQLALTHTKVHNAIVSGGARSVQATDLVTSSVRGQRLATIQASQQFQDFFIQIQGGTNVLIAFSQQASQLAFVMATADDGVGKFARFMAGGWGTAILAGISVLSVFLATLGSTAAEAAKTEDKTLSLVDALDKSRAGTEASTKALKEYNAEQNRSRQNADAMIKLNLQSAEARLREALAIREQIKAQIEKALLDEGQARNVGGGQLLQVVTAGNDALAKQDALIGTIGQSLRNLRISDASRDAKAAVDPIVAINNRYDDMAKAAERAAAGNDALSKSLKGTLTGIERNREADLAAERKRQEAARASRRGTSTVRTESDLRAQDDRPTANQISDALSDAFPGTRVTSAFRTREANRRVGGAARSFHLTGQAVDFQAPAGTTKAAIRAALEARGLQIAELLGPGDKGHDDHFHVAVTKGKAALDGFNDAQREAKSQARELARDLEQVQGRFDPTAEAASIYAEELSRIVRLEAAGVRGGGISKDTADSYRAAAATARDRAVADAKLRAAEEALTPLERATAEMDQQYQVQVALLAGGERAADIARLQAQLQEQYRLSKAEALQLATQQVDREQAINDAIDRRRAAIDIQVQAARQLQSAFTDFLTDPFGKGSLGNLQDQLTQSRKQQIGETLGLKLFGNDMGAQVYRALTQNNGPTQEAATALKTAAGDLSAAAGKIGAANDNVPSALQRATTPTAFGFSGFSSLGFAGPSGITLPLGGEGTRDQVIAQVQSAARLGAISTRFGAINDKIGRVLNFGQGTQVALTYAAGLIGGKVGRAIDAVGNINSFTKLGDQVGKQIGGKLGTAVGGAVQGLGIGQAVGSIYSALGVKGASGGSAIGGAIGGAAFGPIGALGGAVLGGLIGNAFYKPKFGTASLSSASGDFSVAGRGSSQKSAANSLGQAVQDGIQQIADQLGAQLGGFNTSIGVYDNKYRVSTTGYAGKLNFKNTAGKGLVDFGDDQAAAIKFAIADAVRDGALLGLRLSTQRLVQGGSDIERQLQKALKFESIFTELKRIKDPVGAALDDIEKQFKELRDIAAEAGASAEEAAQLEELYGLKRAAAIKEAQDSISAQLKGFLDDLTYKGDTGLSLRTREARATDALAPLIADIMAGKKVDQGQFTDVARSFLDIKRLLFGSTDPYFQALAQITELTNKAIANTGVTNVIPLSASQAAAAAAASQPAFSIPEDRVAMMTATQFTSAVEAGMRAQTESLLAALGLVATTVSRTGNASGGNTDSGLSAVSALRNA